MEVPTIVYWKGERVDELSREELIDALIELGRAYEEQLDLHNRSLKMFSLFRKARQS